MSILPSRKEGTRRGALFSSSLPFPRFAATLAVSEDLGGRPASAQLTIGESTSFKQLVHLSLRFGAPSDAVLRRHLGEVLRQYQNELYQLRTAAGGAASVGPGGGIPVRIDLSRQPSMPMMMNEPPPAGGGGRAEERIRYLEEQNQQLAGQKMALEAELTDLYRRHNIAKPMSMGPAAASINTTYDINKANEIIRKLQDEVKSLRNRARAAEASMRQLEKIGKETGSSYESLTAELHQARGSLEEKGRALAEALAGKERLARELEESKKLVEANEKVIEWLHQQINEDSLSRLLGPGTTGGAGTTYRYSSAGNHILPSWLGRTAATGTTNAADSGNNQPGGAGTISTSSSSPL